MEVDNDNSINSELSNDHEEKEKLLNEISMLQADISQLESMIETPKFGQLKFSKELLTSMHDNKGGKLHIPDVQTELYYELYQFVGLRCREFDEGSRLVFEICSTEQNLTENNMYAVEILINENGCGKLGKWVLPMSVDVKKILSKYPTDNFNIKHFVRTCKHHVDCYICRLKQFKELQDFVSGIKNIHLSHNFGITSIQLVISGVKDVDADKFYNIILYLYYKSATARPYKLSSDTDDDERPSPILIKKLNKYFKCFLKKDLISAFLQISELQTEFVWNKNKANDNEDIMEVFDQSDEDESMGFLMEFLHRSEKKQKKNKDKVQNKKRTLHEDEMKSSLTVEEGNCEDINVIERDDSGEGKKIKSRKRKQLARTIVKPRKIGMKKSQADLKRLRNKMSGIRIQDENDGNITDSDYHTELQMEDNYNYKKDLKTMVDKNKKIHKELLNESNNSNSEHSVNSQKIKKPEKKRLSGFGQTENKKKYNISNNDCTIINSTPVSKKLSKKAKNVFHEISSIRKNEDSTIKNNKKI